MRPPGRPQLSVCIRNFAAEPRADWRYILDQARAAEDAGVDRVFVSDHVVFGTDLSAYGDPSSGGVDGGRQPTDPDGDWIDALTAITAMSAVTSRVRLATNVLVAPLRRPVLLAKTASSIDVLSRGRFELGVGVGWQEAEYRAAGVEFRRRGRLLDELLDACSQLWTVPEVTMVGEEFSLDSVHMMPKPIQAGGVPVWIGGRARTEVARRIVRHAAGWIPWGTTPATFDSAVGRMRQLVEAEGGDFGRVQVAYPLVPAFRPSGGADYPAMFGQVRRLFDNGVGDFRTLLRVPPDYAGAHAMLTEMVEQFERASV